MDFLQRIKKGAGKATEKAQSAVEISKINTQIGNIEREMGIYYQRMGQVFYEGYRVSDMSQAETEMMELAKTCDLLQEEKDELRFKIAELRNERLCACGKVVPVEAVFCPYCGLKLEKTPPRKSASGPDRTTEEETASALEKDIILPYEKESDYDHLSPMEEKVAGPLESDRHVRELERERERQLELDRRIRTWKENASADGSDREVRTPDLDTEEAQRTTREREFNYKSPDHEEPAIRTVPCQICTKEIAEGTKWCPHCGSEQI
ncbi:RNA polymerase subunit RPABC4/transcription elongation factor Spt4 [Paenibacillus shirakamiensis]|uniref:RNA polymerase subunit RPABC4/transcription elongation factor Spt4 n=1 Tax=Paenibacillus shirakamiensis TaxID=1265935 RepID=A0ABS4JIV3_9BACL|nr:zinc ribbon domain-containing protein [Paenibacillus shirakamiensis]MBP2001639.1 RNA polymerase subunit RPABC4/transcription elongation factor Spt4 [Paenibacillus shirakamiensis]